METLNNLCKAFLGECQARNRYTFYSKIAMKEGYEQIAAIFLETAEQEKIHAKRIFEEIQKLKTLLPKEEQTEVRVDSSVPTVYSTTIENLKAAISGEHHEYSDMYPEFARVAEKERFTEIAKRLQAIAKAEVHHAERYKKLLKQLEEKTIFKKKKNVVWVCRECGYMHTGREPPEVCPSCNHPRAFFELQCEEY